MRVRIKAMGALHSKVAADAAALDAPATAGDEKISPPALPVQTALQMSEPQPRPSKTYKKPSVDPRYTLFPTTAGEEKSTVFPATPTQSCVRNLTLSRVIAVSARLNPE